MSTTHSPAPTASEPAGAPRRPAVDVAQYGLAGVVALLGAYVVYDASTLNDGFADQPVQPYAMPYVVGAALLLLGVALAVATARGDRPAAEEGEDVDLAEPSDWRTVGGLVAVMVANIALIDFLGWAITGALLFTGCAYFLGARSILRALAIGVVLSVGTFYGFYSGLGIPMPAGILDGIL